MGAQIVSRHAYRSSGGFPEREGGEPGGEKSTRDEDKQDWNDHQPTMRLKLTCVKSSFKYSNIQTGLC